jgi:hypothetical protein
MPLRFAILGSGNCDPVNGCQHESPVLKLLINDICSFLVWFEDPRNRVDSLEYKVSNFEGLTVNFGVEVSCDPFLVGSSSQLCFSFFINHVQQFEHELLFFPLIEILPWVRGDF